MCESTPIVVILEVQRNAPFIKLEFSALSGGKLSRPSSMKTLQSKRNVKKEKALLRAEDEPGTLPPVAADVSFQDTNRSAPSATECLGRRKYAEVVVQTFTGDELAASCRDVAASVSEPPQGCSMRPTASGSSISSKAGSEPFGGTDIEKVSYFSGNPFVEKTSGILHFYKHSERGLVADSQCSMLCMLGVPSQLTCRELLRFVSPSVATINAMKVIRDSTPNQYMLIIQFKSHEFAVQFFNEYNGAEFNSIEPDRCSLVFVERVETVHDDAGCLPVKSLTELPTCAVCLERMDDGVLTILCNHTFHAQCLEQWTDTTCPVCRHSQTPEIAADQKCFDCGKTTDLWICLICGNIGCGRYADAHAYRHFVATSHTFTLQIGGQRVWDYAGDNYVHRLIQTSTDGKMVEYQRNPANQNEGNLKEDSEEKMEAMQLEYTCLLTSQLENQRAFFENKLFECDKRFENIEATARAQKEELEGQIKKLSGDCENLGKELSQSLQVRQSIEKKLQNTQQKLNKALADLSDERTMSKVLLADQEKWTTKVSMLEEANAALRAKYTATVDELNEQVRDLMMHFEAQAKVQEAVKGDEVSKREMEEGTLEVAEPQPSPSKSRRRAKK